MHIDPLGLELVPAPLAFAPSLSISCGDHGETRLVGVLGVLVVGVYLDVGRGTVVRSEEADDVLASRGVRVRVERLVSNRFERSCSESGDVGAKVLVRPES